MILMSKPNEHLEWKRYEYSNKGIFNNRTIHTFDKVLHHVRTHITNILSNNNRPDSFGINFREIENVGSDSSSVRIKDSSRDQLDRRLLPRLVVTWNYDTSLEPRVIIPNLNDIARVNWASRVSLLGIREKRLTDSSYHYMKDIDLMVAGVPRFGVASIFFTVLLDEKLKAIETAKMLKMMFPIEYTKPLFAETVEFKNWKTPNIIKPYTIECMFPDKLVNSLKDVFNITYDTTVANDTTSDLKLLNILQNHSKEQVDYLVDGSERDRGFVLKYESPINITPKAIDYGETEIGNIATYAIKLELQVEWIEYSVFQLTSTYIRINEDAPTKQLGYGVNESDIAGAVEIPVAHFSEQINDTTIIDRFKLEYADEDIVVNDISSYATINIYDIITDTQMVQYLKHLEQCVATEDIPLYFNIECQRGERFKDIPHKNGMDYGFIIDYDDFIIMDSYGKSGNKIFVAIYINKSHYNDWLEQNGYRHISNLSTFN